MDCFCRAQFNSIDLTWSQLIIIYSRELGCLPTMTGPVQCSLFFFFSNEWYGKKATDFRSLTSLYDLNLDFASGGCLSFFGKTLVLFTCESTLMLVLFWHATATAYLSYFNMEPKQGVGVWNTFFLVLVHCRIRACFVSLTFCFLTVSILRHVFIGFFVPKRSSDALRLQVDWDGEEMWESTEIRRRKHL